jgi:hypothetical protein
MKFRLSGEYGELSPVRDNIPHHGIDFAMPEGTTLRSISDGVVERVVDFGENNLGKGVMIRNEDGTLSIYGHMDDIDVKQGAEIHAGDALGLSGNTGNSTGPHLHYGMKDANGEWLDPTPIAEQVAATQGDVGVGQQILEWYNGISDKIVGAEIEFILRPIGGMLHDAAIALCRMLTEAMPEIGAGITVICAVGIMLTGNVPKWLGRWAVGMGGAIIWLLNA